MEMNKEVSRRMNMLRFLMIFGVVMLHTSPHLMLGSTPVTVFEHVRYFFQGAVFRTTVPILTFISAYLIFSSGLDRAPRKLYEKKFYSLVIPFIVFNLGLLAVTYFSQRFLHVHILRDLLQAGPREWVDAAFGLIDTPINYPLHFLRNLVVLVLFAPLLGMLLRRAPYLGLALMFCIAQFDLDGWLLARNNMLVVFYMGGMAAVLRVNMMALDKYRVPALAVFLLACVAVVAWRASELDVLVYASPFLVWPAASLLDNTRLGNWMIRMSPYSFFIFLAHSPLLSAAWSAYRPLRSTVSPALYWFATPVLVVAFLVVVWKICNAAFGPAFALATGCYKKKRARAADAASLEIQPATHLK